MLLGNVYIKRLVAFEDALLEKIDSLVHECALSNELTFKRHQSFIRSHLFGVLIAAALYPVYLWRTGSFGFLDIIILAWFMSPLLSIAYLSRSGNIAIAHLISSLNLSLFVIVGAGLTGGINSFLIAWMVIVPLEAALSGRRRIIIAASVSAALALFGLYFASIYGLLPVPKDFRLSGEALLLFGLFSATSYGSAIAMAVQAAHEDSSRNISESEKKYRLMAENVTDMISVHDQNGDVIFASPAAHTLFDRPPENLLEDGLLYYVHISDRPIFMTAISNCINDHNPVSVEFRVRKSAPNNSDKLSHGMVDYIWVEMRCRWLEGEAGPKGQGGQILAVTRDISTHKTQEIELLDARDQAEKANVAKTRFLANMSHELRTPLNAIIGFSDVLNQELFGKISNKKYSDYGRLINEAGEHLLSVVNDILDMSKIEVGKFTIVPESFGLPKLIVSCCEMMEPAANAGGVEITVEHEQQLEDICADSRAVKQMLINLISNAIKFSEEGAKVVVRSSLVRDTVYLDVIDEGIGISAEDLPKLCNPFVQADSSYKREHEGVGLGLSVVKGLAELHGGAFKISSELGAGTKARIELPLDGRGALEDGDLAAPQVDLSQIQNVTELKVANNRS